MSDWWDIMETLLHMLFTTFAWCVSHWEGLAGAILFCLQAAVLIKKLRER